MPTPARLFWPSMMATTRKLAHARPLSAQARTIVRSALGDRNSVTNAPHHRSRKSSCSTAWVPLETEPLTNAAMRPPTIMIPSGKM